MNFSTKVTMVVTIRMSSQLPAALLLALASGVSAPGKWEVAARGAAASMATDTLASLIAEHSVVIFSSRGRSTTTERVKSYFEDLGIPYYELAVDEREDGADLQKAIASHRAASSGSLFGRSDDLPAVFIRGQHIQGGSHGIERAAKSGELEHWVRSGEAESEQRHDEGVVEVVIRT